MEVPSKSFSAPSTPTEQPKRSHDTSSMKKKKKHRVHFPEEENLVTCYLDPPNPWSLVHPLTIDTLLSAYVSYCEKQGIEPVTCVTDQLQEFQNKYDAANDGQRLFDFNLQGEKIGIKQCEALEEVFRRIKFVTVDIEGCSLEEECASALFGMIEYYDSASHLNISFIKFIDCRGWQACARMLKKTNALTYLSARSTTLNEQILLILGRPLRMGSNLTTLHLENSGIYGRCLVVLVVALKSNTTLRELFLAENKISSSDGFQLGNLLRTNTHLELLDLSNNKLQNEGLVHLMESLGQQSNTSGRGLSTLILWNNELTRQGMACIAKALNSARTLKRFNLGSNSITSQGVEDLKHSFICNQTLEVLELENCKLTAEGAISLAEFITSNSIIQKIDLRGNDIALEGIKSLSMALEANHSIVSLHVDPTSSLDFDQPLNDRVDELQRIIQYCTRNKEEKRYEPAQDVYLSTLFNGIFSRVLPSSALIQTKEDIANNTIQKGRFKILPVSLEEDLLKKVEEEDDAKPLDPRAQFFASMIAPPTSPPPPLPVNGNIDDQEEGNDILDSNDVFLDDLQDWDKNNFKFKRRHSDVPISPSLATDETSNLVRNSKLSNLALDLSLNASDLPAIEKERRLSSPICSTQPPIFRKVHSCKFKCCTTLESLDLCTSLPLSPTRLYENFSFPQPSVEDLSMPPQCSSESGHARYHMVH